MARVLGVICEYNPFHNGHLYHLIEAKKQTGAEYTIAVMSGNFVQRGCPSVVDKWTKVQMALLNGVDLVIELPTIYATSSAENFAYGAIKILDSLKVVDTLSFGSEISDIDILNRFASVLYHEPKEYVTMLNHELSKGISFPKARENALLMYLNDIRKYANVLSGPNNILGIEYLKALKRVGSPIMPHTLKRKGSDYHEEEINGPYASATAIRKLILANNFKLLSKTLPTASYHLLEEQMKKGNIVKDLSCFDKEIIYTLRKMSVKEIAELPDVSEGLENSIKNAANSCNTVLELINIVKSKRFTQTRIQRILLYSLLGITKKDMQMSQKISPYIRVLGFSSKGKLLLSEIVQQNPKLQVITSVKKYFDNCNNKSLKAMLEKDIFATNVYTIGYEYDSWANLDYTKKIIRID